MTHVAPQEFESTQFGPHESGIPEQCCDGHEAPKLGSESIANFNAGAGVPANRNTIH